MGGEITDDAVGIDDAGLLGASLAESNEFHGVSCTTRSLADHSIDFVDAGRLPQAWRSQATLWLGFAGSLLRIGNAATQTRNRHKDRTDQLQQRVGGIMVHLQTVSI
jgi:hypothetical protein